MDLRGLPPIIVSFLSFKLNIQNRSPLTVKEYSLDLRCFFRYIISMRTGVKEEEVDLSTLDADLADSVTVDEIYNYLIMLAAERKSKETTRSRKLSAIKSFYKFHATKSHQLKNNPAKDVDAPRLPGRDPIVMTLEESKMLLDSFDKADPYFRRNYLIVLIFLNCGVRLSELVGINLADIDSNFQRFTVRGKGNTSRSLYFNSVCREALVNYLLVREHLARASGKQIKDRDALFLSARGNRISQKTVQWMIKRQLELSGLDRRGYSVHKLRHTAATLMYSEGNVDILVLKEILGHAQLNTTQIYTHVKNTSVQIALENNPLNNSDVPKHKRRIKRASPPSTTKKQLFDISDPIRQKYGIKA